MSGDILARIDATVAGRCPCGADPAPGSAWCSEDCRPVPGAGLDYAGEQWTPDGPAMAVGAAPAARRAYLDRLMAVPEEPVELQVMSADGMFQPLRPGDPFDVMEALHRGERVVVTGGGGGAPNGRAAPARIVGRLDGMATWVDERQLAAWQRYVLGRYFAADYAAAIAAWTRIDTP